MEEKLGKYFANESSDAECREVLEWRAASAENAESFLKYKTVWSASQSYQPKASVEDLLSRSKVRPIQPGRWIKYAASIVLAMAAITALYYLSDDSVSTLTKVVDLEDGTEVTLYKDATLTTIEQTEGTHVVRLAGRAYFDVVPDASRDFIILTDEARIEVLGTSFLVNNIEENITEVIVESGVVSFSQNPENFRGKRTSVSLKAGEKGMLRPDARGLIKQNNRDKNYLAWANGVLIFESDEMKDVASLIGEVYGFEVEFENSMVMDCKLTATYKKKSPKQIAKLISETFGFSYQISNGKIIFSGAGC